MTIDALSEAIIAVSDNTAANLLLARIGGPVALTEQLRRWGDDKTRLDRNEPSLNTNIVGDPRDTTTPAAMTALMQTILMGDALSNGSRDQLIRWLKNCRTGMSRIRAGIPRDWDAGDKTGTGANGAVNDLAILWPPNRAPILVAIYMSGSRVESEKLNAGHARIGEWVGRFAARG
jgi:beta-lactamase class A